MTLTELENLLWEEILANAINMNDMKLLASYTFMDELEKKALIKTKLDERISAMESQKVLIGNEIIKINALKSSLDTPSKA